MSSEAEKKITGTALKQIVLKYVPRQFLKDVDISKLGFDNSKVLKDGGVEILQRLLDNSNNQLRMYGTAKDFAQELHSYRWFPSNHRKFGIDLAEEYINSPYPYVNQKSVMFFCKQDLFIYIQHLIFMKMKNLKHQLPRSIIMIFLKICEEKVSGCFEFVKDDKGLNPIDSEISKAIDKIKKNKDKLKPPSSSFEEMFEEWKSFLPNWTVEQYEHIRKALQSHIKFFPPEKFPEVYAEVFWCSKILIEMLREVIDSRPEMFLPYDKSKFNNAPAVVRVFGDGNQTFVMKSELYKAINMSFPNQKPLKCEDEQGFLCAMEMDEVHEKFGGQIKKIEFLQTPPRKTRLAAIPIMTPTGGYCILAINAFPFIFRRLISVVKIFQKIKKNSWHIITDYMKWLKKELHMDMKCRYFVTFDVIEKIEEQTYEYFKEYENQPVKSIRDVRKVGFTVNNLKNELTYLGLTDVFPKITEYADFVHGMLTTKYRGAYLGTRDLFEAVEECQMHCIPKIFSGMDVFLHNQKPCDKSSNRLCGFCLSHSNTSHSRGSTWNEYKYSDVKLQKFENLNGDKVPHWYMVCSDGTELYSNYSFGTYLKTNKETDELKYFILDRKEIKWLQDNAKNMRGSEKALLNLETFMDLIPNKTIYIRSFSTVPSTDAKSEETRRVFTDEVLEIILMIVGDRPIDTYFGTLEEYQTKWTSDNNNVSMTISLDEFKEVLEDLDIDKKLITIVPDMYFMRSEYQIIRNTGTPTLNISDAYGVPVMDTSQAIFYIFQSVVCNVYWGFDYCTKHENCSEQFKKTIINAMEKYANMGQGAYISCEHVKKVVKKLRKHCNYIIRKGKSTPLMKLSERKFNDNVSKEFFIAEFNGFLESVPPEIQSFASEKEYVGPVWLIRHTFLICWIKLFYFGDYPEIEAAIENALKFKLFEMKSGHSLPKDAANIPDELELDHSEGDKESENSKGSDQKGGAVVDKESEHDPIELEIDEKKKNIVETTSEESINKEESQKKISPEEAIENIKRLLKEGITEDSNPIRSSDDLKDDSTLKISSEKTENESKCCEKCLQTNSRLNETEEELETAKDELKMANKRAGIWVGKFNDLKDSFEEYRSKSEEKEEKNREVLESLKKQNSDLSKCAKENEVLKNKISKITENETKWKESNKKLTDARNQVLKRVTQLESQLESEKKKNEENEKEMINLKKTTETQLKSEKRKNEELEKEVIRQKKLIETNQKNISIKESLENEISKNKEIIAEITDSRNRLLKKVQQLEAQSRSEIQKTQKLEQEVARQQKLLETKQADSSIQKNVENEISENRRIIAELREANMRLSIKNEEQDRMYKILIDKLAPAPATTSSNHSMLSTPPNTPRQFEFEGVRFQLVALRKIKDNLQKGNSLKEAKEMQQKLLSLTNRADIHQLANDEFEQFERQLQIYTDAVEANIQILKKSDDSSDLPSLPEFPSFSDRFKEEYRKEMEKQPSPSSEMTSELADSECLICLANMETSDETIKCENCRRRFHMECASKWLKRKSICPACSRGLLNPNEFPSLS